MDKLFKKGELFIVGDYGSEFLEMPKNIIGVSNIKEIEIVVKKVFINKGVTNGKRNN